jgi:hypothetical protein
MAERSGTYGAIENALDDVRHTWEQSVYGREVTGEVSIAPAETPEIAPAYSADDLYQDAYRPIDDPSDGRGMDIEPPDIER